MRILWLIVVVLGVGFAFLGFLRFFNVEITEGIGSTYCIQCLGLESKGKPFSEGMVFTEGIDILSSESINTINFLEVERKFRKDVVLIVFVKRDCLECEYAAEIAKEFFMVNQKIKYKIYIFGEEGFEEASEMYGFGGIYPTIYVYVGAKATEISGVENLEARVLGVIWEGLYGL